MIQIAKSRLAPAVLTSRGARHRKQLEAAQAADPAACAAPDSTWLAPKDGIYNDAKVKQQLRADQHDKCCYCESHFSHTSYGDVEHFRPKGGYQQDTADRLHKPGYYWLAYAWNNLYLACQLCNQRHKGNYFPLVNPAVRACAHTDALAAEQSLLPDPATEDPAVHLTFVQDAAQALDVRGACCIWVFGLDRPELIKRRLEKLRALKYTQFFGGLDLRLPLNPAIATFLQEARLTYAEGVEMVTDAQRTWEESALDPAEFAGMVRANFPYLPTV